MLSEVSIFWKIRGKKLEVKYPPRIILVPVLESKRPY